MSHTVDAGKGVFRGNWLERSQINDLSFHLKKVGQVEQIKPQNQRENHWGKNQ